MGIPPARNPESRRRENGEKQRRFVGKSDSYESSLSPHGGRIEDVFAMFSSRHITIHPKGFLVGWRFPSRSFCICVYVDSSRRFYESSALARSVCKLSE